LVITDFKVLDNAQKFLTDNIFALFAILGCYYLVKFLHERKEKQILLCSVFFTLATLMRMSGIIFFPVEILLVSLYSLYLVYSRRLLNKNLNYENSQKNTVLKTNPFLTFSKNIKKLNTRKTRNKILKTSILLFIPWLIFFSFYFSYNSYYFGEAQKDYKEAGSTMPGFKQPYVQSFFTFDSDRLDWIQSYSIGFMPDRVKYGLADLFSVEDLGFTDKIPFRTIQLLDNNWFSIFTFIILFSAVGISFIYKVKRIEVIVLFFMILGIMFVFSSSTIILPFEKAELRAQDLQERYMLTNHVFASMLFGFVMIKVYEIKFEKIPISKRRFVSNGFKIIFLLILGLLLFVSIFYSTPMLDVYESDFEIRDLRGYVKGFPLESGLPDNSILIVPGRGAILYDMIPFFTKYTEKGKFDPSDINDDDILILIDRMDEGYNVYSVKNLPPIENKFHRYLEEEHGLISIQDPGLFCKVEKITDLDSDPTSYDRCYNFEDLENP